MIQPTSQEDERNLNVSREVNIYNMKCIDKIMKINLICLSVEH